MVTLFPDHFVVQDLQTRTLIGKGKLRDGLYYWDRYVSRLDSMALATQQSGTPSDIWHQRLGHPSFEKLHALLIRDSIDSCHKVDHCDVCVRAKQTRLPFQSSSIKTSDGFELFHYDIWGAYRTPSLTSARYLLTIVDDYSRAVWVYLLKHKSEVGSILPTICTMIRTQFGHAARRIRADNGFEFQSQHIRQYYDAHGIILDTSCTDTPQQNGVVERKHRHILEMARALRFQSGLPLRFWGDCVLASCYLINRLPVKPIDNDIHYQRLFGSTPDYGRLRTFGCLAYTHNNQKGIDKFGNVVDQVSLLAIHMDRKDIVSTILLVIISLSPEM
ncbi:Retrovirus-related Pol polyprotein from transposon RE2 [Linum grandiflorum]